MNKIMWQPDETLLQESAMRRFIDFVAPEKPFDNYQQLHAWSIQYREDFWSSVWRFFNICSSKPWRKIVSDPDDLFLSKWFVGSELNFAENLLKFRDQSPAIEFHNEAGLTEQLSYADLYQRVAVLAAALRHAGIKKGDRVVAILPNIPETIIAMLASASLGAIWSCCAPDFGRACLLDRLGQIKPRLLFYADAWMYKGKKHDAVETVTAVLDQLAIADVVAIPYLSSAAALQQRQIPGVLFDDFIQHSQQAKDIDFVPCDFSHPLYILYSSGTTGIPKCIVHGVGGTLLQHLKELGLHADLKREDKLFYYTSTGWMMWNWMVSGLAFGATLLLYDGSPFYPKKDSLLALVAEQEVTVFGCSAKYISVLNNAAICLINKLNIDKLRLLLSTGSPLAEESYDYVYSHISKQVQLSSISGGTDIVSCFALGNPLSAVYRGELQGPGLGMAVEVFDDHAGSVIEQKGELVCTKSFPCMPVSFWNDPGNKKYHAAYFEGFPDVWTHGDFAEITASGGLVIFGRSDATLNPSGVRIGTAEIYRQLESFVAITDALVVGQEWQGDQRIILFLVLGDEHYLDAALTQQIKQKIRQNTSAYHVPKIIVQVRDIPRTLNGKVAELAVTDIIHGRVVKNLSSLANPESLQAFKTLEVLRS